MASIALVPAAALLTGAVCGLRSVGESLPATWLIVLVIAGWITWHVDQLRRLTVAVLTCGFFSAAALIAANARESAIDTPLRAVLDREVGGFGLDASGAVARHDPIAIRARLTEDGADAGEFTSARARVEAVRLDGSWQLAAGDVMLTIGGVPSPDIVEWRAGRTIETFATFRRPSRFLNDGVPDFERQLALDGTTLFASVKSGLLVEVVAKGSVAQELAGRVRVHVRRSVERWVAPHSRVSAAIATAVLVGDRTALPDEVRLRLQEAGTYHVIAISGGNIAILAGLVLGALLVCGITGRFAALLTVIVLVGYAQVVTAEASVWRATLMAALYFGARMLDHRSSPWNAVAMSATVIVCLHPLDVRNVGFILTFGATAALIEAARRTTSTASRPRVLRWLIASVAASTAAELVLFPVSASTFSRVTCAGLVLNLVAVPVMGLVQLSSMAVALFDRMEMIAGPAGWMAHVAAVVLIDSARLVEWVPWLVTRVPPPPAVLVIAYYAAFAVAVWARGTVRTACAVVAAAAAAAIVTGQPSQWPWTPTPATLNVIAFDVGQGDATLLEFPGGSTLLVDAGGMPCGGGAFDIGSRVLAPAIWARGLRRLDTLALTHGDPDHIGGAAAVVNDFAPAEVWEGVPVPSHRGLQTVLQTAVEGGAAIARRFSGDATVIGGAAIRVLHPSPPDWERPRVRNDDSLVLEVRYGDAAVLLLGDVGVAVERSILAQLTPARIRILKVAHHGSRTSTSLELVERWRPQIAVISCGRGNTFGHPAPEVISRLESIGAAIYRTDVDGQVTIETDGKNARVRTYMDGTR